MQSRQDRLEDTLKPFVGCFGVTTVPSEWLLWATSLSNIYFTFKALTVDFVELLKFTIVLQTVKSLDMLSPVLWGTEILPVPVTGNPHKSGWEFFHQCKWSRRRSRSCVTTRESVRPWFCLPVCRYQCVLQRKSATLKLFHTEEAGGHKGSTGFLKLSDNLAEELQTEPPFTDSHLCALSAETCCLPALSGYTRHLPSCIFSPDIVFGWNWALKIHSKLKTVNIP